MTIENHLNQAISQLDEVEADSTSFNQQLTLRQQYALARARKLILSVVEAIE